PMGTITSITMKVTGVYEGSKYDDTCIAEVDFWSDWVNTRDADAAYNYYQNYKADAALRPVGLESSEISMGDVLTSCGKIDTDRLYTLEESPYWDAYYRFGADSAAYGYSYEPGWSHYSFNDWEFPIVVSAEMNSWAEVGDEIVVKWVAHTSFPDPEGEERVSVWNVDYVEVEACGDDSLVISSGVYETDLVSNAGGCVFGSCHAEFYYEDKLVGISDEFGLTQ
ncbi:MAG: hypothetical protein Q8P27_00985, partial [Candidatus Peregrinibacteria bacterium]|nr:hypothetical protein [Candidatus Peregrinibacteria bacterium]